MNKVRARITAILSIVILWLLKIISDHIYFNPSKSQTVGYYWVYKAEDVKKGDIVMVCIKDKARIKVLHRLGLPAYTDGSCSHPYLLKKVIGAYKDEISITDAGVKVNSILYKNTLGIKQYKDIKLNPLRVGSTYHLGHNDYFLLGSDKNSYDSRYFGVVDIKEINFRAILLFARNTQL